MLQFQDLLCVPSDRPLPTGPSRPPLRQSGFATPGRYRPMRLRMRRWRRLKDDVGDPTSLREEGGLSLEEILQAEADNLALELEEAMNEGVDAHVIEDLEESVESAAEALLTMKEARSKLSNIRDRNYVRTSASGQSTPKRGGASVQSKKTAKNPCFECGEAGHLAGRGGRPPVPVRDWPEPRRLVLQVHQKGVKQVKIAEALQLVAGDPGSQFEDVHEIHMATHVNLKGAWEFHHQQVPAEVNAAAASSLSWDKRLMGALYAACNRACIVTTWLPTYLQCLQRAPEHIRQLAFSVPEHEVFRFGNGSTQVSEEGWRLPVLR